MDNQTSSSSSVAEYKRIQTRPTILVSESQDFSELAEAKLREYGDLLLEDCNRDNLIQSVARAEVLWIRLRHRIDREVLEAGKHLKMIVTPTTGLNHIDLATAAEKEIRVLSLRGEADFLKDVRATAELTIGLMLALIRRISHATNHVVHGGWNRDLFRGSELCGKTVGIVGFGRLGRIVAKYLAAFDARVLAYDPQLDDDQFPSYAVSTSLEALLQRSDIVTLHANLTAENTRFFGKREFGLMRAGSWFINTARGELVDENALEASLRKGHLRGAALDVLSDEQSFGMSEHPLVCYARDHDHLIVTPHIGGATAESMAKTEVFMAEQFCQIWPTLIGQAHA
jgi:D-3-phosphoglycerate dehydrogenase / 2-oxoglutarate reductase